MRFATLAPLALAAAAAAPALAVSGDYTGDFGVASNPNGAWTYGYTTTLGGPLVAFTAVDTANGYQQRFTPGLSGDQTPSAFKRTAAGSVNGLPSGQAALHPGPGGQYAVARFTADVAVGYLIGGAFGAGDQGAIDAHVLIDGATPAAFSALGATAEVPFSLGVQLAPGGTVDFVVGTAGSYAFDTTPLDANVVPVPEPTVAATLALVGAALARRRAR